MLVISIPVSIYAEEETQVKILEQVYPGLTSGALRYAKLSKLADGILLKAEDIEVTSDNIARLIESQPLQGREEFTKNALFILEQQATQRILPMLARKTSSQPGDNSPEQDNAIIQRFFENEVFKNLEVTDLEVQEFYENNKDMCGEATLEQIKGTLKNYVLSQKKQELASEYIGTLGKIIKIEVSEDWVTKQAVLALDNPVDKARQSGKPSLVDFGATGCKPCDMLAPILDALREKYKDNLNVVFVHVREKPNLASRYNVQSIPVQIFYDKNGKEIYRHTGFWPQEELEKKLKEIGVQ